MLVMHYLVIFVYKTVIIYYMGIFVRNYQR